MREFPTSLEARLELLNRLDFENPQDADGGNVYVVDVVASDGVNRTIQTVELTITDDPSDNANASSVSDGVSIFNVSHEAEFGLESYLSENSIPEFEDQFVSLDVFESAQLNAIAEPNPSFEDDIWTIQSVAFEPVSNETDLTASVDEVYAITEEDAAFFEAAPGDFVDDVWL